MQLNDAKEQIEKLKHEIFQLWCALDKVLPEAVSAILGSYRDCASPDDVWKWRRTIAEKILELATPRPDREMGDLLGSGERAYCPLCKGGTLSPYHEEGYRYPGGLLRHLQGEGNTHECLVMEVAVARARDYARDEHVQDMRRRFAQMDTNRARKKGKRS